MSRADSGHPPPAGTVQDLVKELRGIVPATASGIDDLDTDSKSRSQQIEKLLFKYSRDVLGDIDTSGIFVVTGDLTDGLLYGPVTNFSRRALLASSQPARSNGSAPNTVPSSRRFLDQLRDLFPLEALDAAGVLSRAANELYDADLTDTTLALVIDPDGTVANAVLAFDGSEERVENFIGQSLGEGVKSGLSSLRTSLDGTWYFCVCLQKADGLRSLTPKREVKPVVVGVVAVKQQADACTPGVEKYVEIFNGAAPISLLGTAALLLEKERYFQKALRQAVQGSIIKCGSSTELADQVLHILERQVMGKPTVPSISDCDLPPGTAKGGWYRMSRYELPSLLDLFTTAGNLQDYEVRAIVRACTRHLADTYWGNVPHVEKEVDLRYQVLVTLALAEHHVQTCCRSITDLFDHIKDGKPVRVGKGVDVFMHDREAISRMEAIVATMHHAEPQGFFLQVDWSASAHDGATGGAQRPKKEHCVHPLTALNMLREAAREMESCDTAGRWLVVQRRESSDEGGALDQWRIHGDAHFGNLLVDASVPEDSLVVSIDPRFLRYGEDEGLRDIISKKLSAILADGCTKRDDAIVEALRRCSVDPLFDIAKLFLSTSCAYGVAYRNGFGPVVKLSEKEDDDRPFLLKRPSRDMRKLSETGGISGDLLVRIQAPVTADAWDYHASAVGVILQEWERWSGPFVTKFDEASKNAAFVCLWLLTVRHTFSIAEKLFPQYPDRAFPMYLLGCRFLSRGLRPVERLLRGQLSPADGKDVADLLRRFDLV